MTDSFECFACHKVYLLVKDTGKKKCPSCGSANGQRISPERVKEGMEAGSILNIDLKTGGPQKKKRRR